MGQKTIEAWLIVDWRDESHRTRKNKPEQRELGTNELPAKVEIEVDVPDVDVPTLSAKIDVPEPRVHAATLEALSDEDLPDWTGAANDVIEGEQAAIEEASGRDLDRLINSMVTTTIIDAPGRPDPELVQDYIFETVQEMMADG